MNLIDLPQELIYYISKKLNNKDNINFMMISYLIYDIIQKYTTKKDKSSRFIVYKLKKYIANNSKKQRIKNILKYYFYKPYTQKGINIYYYDSLNCNNILKQFCLKIRYSIDLTKIIINLNCNFTRLSNTTYITHIIDNYYTIENILDMIEKYDNTFNIEIQRIKYKNK